MIFLYINYIMKENRFFQWICFFILIAVMNSCGVDIPKEKQLSFETMTVQKTDIEVPVKFSAKMKGQADVTIMPQVSGQLMKIYVTEGQQVRKGQTLFAIDSRNAQLNEATNMYNGAMGIIALYIALGGATR